jgi:hypothetical protein
MIDKTKIVDTVINERLKKLTPQLCESRGCPRSKASKGEAVVNDCEPLATPEMGYDRLSRRVNKMNNHIRKRYLFYQCFIIHRLNFRNIL